MKRFPVVRRIRVSPIHPDGQAGRTELARHLIPALFLVATTVLHYGPAVQAQDPTARPEVQLRATGLDCPVVFTRRRPSPSPDPGFTGETISVWVRGSCSSRLMEGRGF